MNKSIENRLTTMEMEIENLHQRIDSHEPIVSDYANRNIVFRIIGIIAVINLLLLLIWAL